MALTAKLEINTPSGDGDITCAIDPALWASSQTTIQSYATAAGVTLYYSDVQGPAGTIEANINSLSDAQYQINQAANRVVSTKGTGPTSDGSNGGVVVAVVAALAVGTAGVLAWLARRRKPR